MITLPLTLRHRTGTIHNPSAWYCASSNSARWVAAIVASSGSQSQVQVLPLPRSQRDRTPVGALLIGIDRPVTLYDTWLPYGRLGKRLFLPAEAELTPAVRLEELESLLGDNPAYVWHPTIGLIGFEDGEILQLADLLVSGRELENRWNCAVPGVEISPRLTSLAPEQSMTIEMLLSEGRDDIGSDVEGLPELPPSPQEARPGMWRSLSRHSSQALANFMMSLTKHASQSTGTSTWADNLRQWADQHLKSVRAGLEAARNKELSRLLHLLETDPDRGLRYALPLGGDAHRGLAPPGGRLTERDLNFNLGRLGGGGAADFWAMSGDYHYQLMARYRELANREQRLGRHRRAAYIYAELLSDYEAAAQALTAGHHFREAAVLYTQRLSRPLDAARCLEEGGLWTEAIEKYAELGEYEKAGDLHAQLDQHSDAADQYRKAVDKLTSHGDYLSAARLLETKLDAVDEAIETLSAGWPDSGQAKPCLRTLFEVLARSGHHQTARIWIARFARQPLPLMTALDAIEIVAETAHNYPEAQVREDATNCTYVVASHHLSAASELERKQLVSAVASLAPHDRLLQRDCRRYAQERSLRQSTARPRRLLATPSSLRIIELPTELPKQAAIAGGHNIFIAGPTDNFLQVLRCDWHGKGQSALSWRMETDLTLSSVLLAAAPYNDHSCLAHVIGQRLLDAQQMPPDEHRAVPTNVGAMRGMTEGTLGAGRDIDRESWLVELRNGSLLLNILRPDGDLFATHALPQLEDIHEEPVFPLPMHVRRSTVYIGIGNQLLTFDKTGWQMTEQHPQPIVSLSGSAPNTRARLAVSYPSGGKLLWEGFTSHQQSFAQDMPHPLTCFTRAGHLVAVGGGKCEVYETHGEKLNLKQHTLVRDTPVIGVLPSPEADQFGIAFADGRIEVYVIT